MQPYRELGTGLALFVVHLLKIPMVILDMDLPFSLISTRILIHQVCSLLLFVLCAL